MANRLIKTVSLTILLTGLRLWDLLSLRIEDVDLQQGQTHAKGSGGYTIPISRGLHRVLVNYINDCRPNANEWDRLFATQKPGAPSVSYNNRVLRMTTTKLGWGKRVTARVLRKTFAYQRIKCGVNIALVQKGLLSYIRPTALYMTHGNMMDVNTILNCLNNLGVRKL